MGHIGNILKQLYDQLLITQGTYLRCANDAANIQTKTQCQSKYEAYCEVLSSIQSLLVQYGNE